MNPHRLVDKHQLLAVRRPKWPVTKSRPQPGQDLFASRTVRRTNRQLVLSRTIAEVSEPLPIGRPRWITLGHARAAREVPHDPVLRRHGEYFAPRLENRPLARRRNIRFTHRAGNILK